MIKKLVENLKKDKGYFFGWQSNIAMAFKDEYARCHKKYKSKDDIHKIANKAAIEFLTLLIKASK
jgi:hypothetical protein